MAGSVGRLVVGSIRYIPASWLAEKHISKVGVSVVLLFNQGHSGSS
jgi:hypothetical protein